MLFIALLFKALGDAFGNAASALSFASSYWYLFFAAFLISPFVPAASKWVSDRVSEGKKAGMSDEGFSAYMDAVIYTKALELSTDKSVLPDERARELINAEYAQNRFNDKSEKAKEEAKNQAKKENNGVKIPPEAK